jgi:hypothetical protein
MEMKINFEFDKYGIGVEGNISKTEILDQQAINSKALKPKKVKGCSP